ncbi:MAG: dienelactone hydrolase family protein [Burkholderiales bacterium]|nr:dienelactone hydrolase family protein [Burkholderiales bacterium]
MIEFTRPDGQTVQGYLAEPANAPDAPGVVVIQEWWGLNAQIRGVADRYAAAGYVALVPDLYRGKSTVEAAEAEHLMTNLNFGDAAGQDVRGAVQYLKTRCPKVGVSGYCMGGALTLLAAVHVPEADAGVVYYGYPPLEFIDAAKIRIPLLGHWAIDDAPFPIANVDTLEQKLRAAGVAFEFHRYPAMHAFANETQVGANRLPITEYQPEAAAAAWERTLGFWSRHLR